MTNIRRLPPDANRDEITDLLDAMSDRPGFEQAIAHWLMTNLEDFDSSLLQRLHLELLTHLK